MKLQKRAAGVILSADSDSPFVQLLNKFKWIPFCKENKMSSYSLVFRLIQGTLPNYLNVHFTVTNQVHTGDTRYAKFNLVCPKYILEAEGGMSFLVRACKILE